MLVATMVARGADEAVAAGQAASRYADLLELRLDVLRCPPDKLEEVIRRMPAPVLATCRRQGDGGEFEEGEPDRVALLRRAVEAGATWVDVEWGSAAEELLAAPGSAHVILSHHEWDAPSRDLEAIHASMAERQGVALRKLVIRATNLEDNLRVRDLLAKHGAKGNLAAFCAGEAGVVSRILALSWGSAATYGSVAGSGAPGQLPVEEMDRLYRVRRIGAGTKFLGVVGRPVGHSLSPYVHGAALRSLDLDFTYLPLHAEKLSSLMALARALPLRGFSVTLPHKEAICGYLDQVDPIADAVGAVNTVVRKDDGWHGWNTDASGGVQPLARQMDLEGCPVAVLGAGGAARALVHALAKQGAAVTVFNRSEARGRELARDAGVDARPFSMLETYPYRVLVQTTPVGMAPRSGEMPLPEDWLHGELVYDVIYNPRETALLKAARRQGLRTLDGLQMFLEQAAQQFERFTGEHAPREVMERAALQALAAREGEARGDG
jgi:3-dehydroquinate dehydratase/shikimate dehydrogenase